MKATGIVRRIDDLGRIVIPKEIRRVMRIREGDPLEIYVSRDGEIILRKYSHIGDMSEFAESYACSIAQTTGSLVCITDRDYVVAAAGPRKKEFEGKPLDRELLEHIETRKTLLSDRRERNLIKITADDEHEFGTEAIAPVISSGDIIGAVVICGQDDDWQPEVMRQLVITAADYLGRQME